jgi:AraC family transcriptional regulator of adaptative response/methylated-DNA-[protein]-cysteine methyltransferase
MRQRENEDLFFHAYQNHDRSFEGIFFLAVKTTGVFCRPGCTARSPKRENVEFFTTAGEALEQGYRPCKKCQPLTPSGDQPSWVGRAVELAVEEKQTRLSDDMLRHEGIDPVRLRRWFKQYYGMTFQAYQRQLKLNRAYRQIHKGASVLDSALDSGFNSLSAFNEAFLKLTGFSPSKSKYRKLIAVNRMLTPLGPMIAAADDDGLCLLEFHDRKQLQRQLLRIQQRLQAQLIPGEHELFPQLQQLLDEYFAGQCTQFSIQLNLAGTDFQLQAWQALCRIPYGETRNYRQQAEMLGKPKAVRAVASANANNPLAIVVPCHRVIAGSGSLTGYAGGIWRKRYLIQLESVNKSVS